MTHVSEPSVNVFFYYNLASRKISLNSYFSCMKFNQENLIQNTKFSQNIDTHD